MRKHPLVDMHKHIVNRPSVYISKKSDILRHSNIQSRVFNVLAPKQTIRTDKTMYAPAPMVIDPKGESHVLLLYLQGLPCGVLSNL